MGNLTTQIHLEEEWGLLAGARGRSGKVLTNQVKVLWEGKARRNQEMWHEQGWMLQCPRISPQTEEMGPLLLIKLDPPSHPQLPELQGLLLPLIKEKSMHSIPSCGRLLSSSIIENCLL